MDHTMDTLNYNVAALEEEKKDLAKEAAKFPDKESLKMQRKDLEREIDTLVVERQKLSLESRRLQRQFHDVVEGKENLTNQLSEANESISELTEELEGLQAKVPKITQENVELEEQLIKQQQALSQAEKDIKRLSDTRTELTQTLAEVDEECKVLLSQKTSCQANLTDAKERLASVKQTLRRLRADEMQLRESSEKMEVDMEHLELEKRATLESTNQVLSSGSKMRKLIRQATKKIKSLEDSLKYLQEAKKTRDEEMDLAKKMKAKMDPKEREKLTSQIAKLTKRLLAHENLNEHEREAIRAAMKEEETMLAEIDSLKVELSKLQSTVTAKSYEVAQKRRYRCKAEQHHIQVNRDLKLQEFQLNDNRKTLRLHQVQLNNLGKLYKAVNVERNECLMLINLAQQRKLEVEEKCRLFTNEMNILKSGIQNKQYQLDELESRLASMREERIVLQTEISKEVSANRELEAHKSWMNTSVEHLKRTIKSDQTQMARLQKDYKTAVHEKDSFQRRLDDCHGEVQCAKETLCKLEIEANKKADKLASETRELSLAINTKRDEIRSIEVQRRRNTEKLELEDELSLLHKEVLDVGDKLSQEERLLDNPAAQTWDFGRLKWSRLRLLEGPEVSQEFLLSKEKEITLKIDKKEAELRELDMILSAVGALVDKLNAKTKAESEPSLQLAKLSNANRREILLKERQMKALCAELRMKAFQEAEMKRTIEELAAEVRGWSNVEEDVTKPRLLKRRAQAKPNEIARANSISFEQGDRQMERTNTATCPLSAPLIPVRSNLRKLLNTL
uniref:Coiled-coil domain-containing protein 39 n=1 Tax=Mesocestoides corti TaxID=53468 RepID=A0A5K3F179_MESCO